MGRPRRDGITLAKRKEDRVRAQILIRIVADPRQPKDTVKSRIARAATRLKWSYQRTNDIWRCYAQRIEAWEMDQLRNWQSPE